MRLQIHHLLVCFVIFGALLPAVSRAEIDFFQTPAEQQPATTKESWAATRATKSAKVLFFIAPGCGDCPVEAAKLESELIRIGLKYQIEGVFVGDPPKLGKYLAALRTYPFKFEIGLDVDGKIAKKYDVKTFPTAVIEVSGKRVVVTRASELSEKLR